MPVTSPRGRAERLYYNQRGCNELTRSLNIHEVARLTRQRRRVVLACFFATSADRPAIFV